MARLIFIFFLCQFLANYGMLAQNLDSGLVAYYPFNGNAIDDSGNGNNATFANVTYTTDRLGIENTAASFNGANQYISVPHSNSIDFSHNNDYAICVWVRPNETQSNLNESVNYVISKWGVTLSEGYSISLRYNNERSQTSGIFAFGRFGGSGCSGLGIAHENSAIQQDYTFFVMQYSNGKQKIYENGNFIREIDATTCGSTQNNAPLLIGAGSTGGSLAYTGELDDLRIYNRNISDEEIQQLYIEGLTSLNPPVSLSGKVLAFDQIELFWEDSNTSEDGYEVWRSINNNTGYQLLNTLSNNTTSYLDTGLVENTTYFYKIKAVSSTVTDSEFSEELQLGTLPKIALNAGLVAHYPFSGDANDVSGNENNGTVQGNTQLTQDRFNNVNSAFTFDGSFDDILIEDDSTLDLSDAMSVSLWFNLNSNNGTTWQTLLSKGDFPIENYALYYNSSGNLYHYSLLGGDRVSYASLPVNIKLLDWYHVVIRFNGRIASTYINGIRIADADWVGKLSTNNSNLFLGSRERGDTELNGKLDDIRIYNRSINEVEIQQLYAEGVAQLNKPTNLAGDVLAYNQIELSWEDTNFAEEGYEIWRSIGDNTNFQRIDSLSNNATSYLDTALVENTTYFYKLKAVSAVITDSEFSDEFQLTTFPKIALDTGLVAYYPFNGNANDESGNGNDGTSFGAELARDRFGNINNAYQFDGIDDYITANPLYLEKRQTLVAWVQPAIDYTSTSQVVIENPDNSTATDYSLYIDKSGSLVEPEYFLRKSDGEVGPSVKSSQTFSENDWILMVGAYDGQSSKIYVNGQLLGESAFTDNLRQLGTSFRIGDDGSDGNAPFRGKIDDVRIYNRALNQDEISAIYDNGGYQENDAALLGYNLEDGEHLPEGANPVQVILQNIGDSVLTDAIINWSVNGIAQPSVNWNGALNLLDTTYIPLGDFDFRSEIIYSIEAVVTSSNDENTLNDIASVSSLFILPSDSRYALNFDGNDYLDISEVSPILANSGNFTFETWFQTSQETQGMLFAINGNSTSNINKVLIDTRNSISVLDGANGQNAPAEIISKIDYTNGKMHHLAYVKMGAVGTLYINGLKIGSHDINYTILSDDLISLGQEFDGTSTSNFYQGILDEVRIWNTARTPEQIRQFMVKNAGLKEQPGLIATWHFGENIGEKAFDIVDGKEAVFKGSPTWVDSEAPIGDNKSGFDAGILSINSPQNTGFEAGEKEIIVTLQNYGNLPLTVSDINWSVNNQLQSVYKWNGVLPPNEQDTVSIGNFNFEDGVSYNLKAWTSNPNGLSDTFVFNDSSETFEVFAGLAGVYTIGGESPDFQTLTEAVEALNKGGISDDVTFNIRPGVYEGQVFIGEFKGSDCSKKITFQSETGRKEDVIIKSTSTSDANYVIQIAGVKGITIQNLTIQSEGNSTYGRVIDLVGNVGCIEITDNHLIGIPTASTDSNALRTALTMLSGQTPVDSIQVSTNLIENGSLGVYFGNPSPQSIYYLISDNLLQNQALAGIETERIGNTNIIGNILSDRGVRSDYQGIIIDNCDQIINVKKNIIKIKKGLLGIQLSNSQPPSDDNALVANNFISAKGSPTVYGIDLFRSNRIRVFHNTSIVFESSTTSSPFRMWNSSSSSFEITLFNNMFANFGLGYSLNTQSWNSTFISNNNLLYARGSNLARTVDGNFPTLSDWQNQYGRDLNSIVANPFFLSDTSYIVTNPELNGAGIPLPQVPFDIEGKPRDTNMPDIGAYEFEVAPNDVGIVSFQSLQEEFCEITDSITISVELLNYSAQAQSSFDVSYSINNELPIVETLPDSIVLLPGNRIVYDFKTKADISNIGTYNILAKVLVNGDLNGVNDTLSIQINNLGETSPVTNLIPEEGSSSIDLPVTFTWAPGENAINYDLYIWPVGDVKPISPTVTNISSIRYTYRGSLDYGETYNWQVIAKNKCSEAESTVQSFTVRTLPNLLVDVIEVQTAPFSGQSIPISWTVKNTGTGSTGNQQWTDALYLSNDPSLSLGGADRDTYIGGFANLRALQAGESYTNQASYILPRGAEGNRYVIVVTDRFNRVLESNESDNDIKFSEPPMDVQLTPPPDLQVNGVVVPNIPVFSSRSYPISWEVVNNGTNPTETDEWYDRIYLTTSPELNPNGATILADVRHRGIIDAGNTYTGTTEITLPQGIDGDFYIFVHSDIRNQVFEHFDEDNNIGRSDTLNVVLLPPPDLAVNEIQVQDTVNSNERVDISWEVQNIGAGDTEVSRWSDAIYLSSSEVLNASSAVFLGSFSYNEVLSKDSLYRNSASLRIPNNIKGGIYYIHVLTDRDNRVFEFDKEDNNITTSAAIVLEVPDLVVSEILPPTAPSSGNPIDIGYSIQNNGPGDLINASFIDEVYLSPVQDIDHSEALLLGRINNLNLTLPSSNRLSNIKSFLLPEGIVGSFYVGIKTDAREAIFEDFREFNNITYSTNPINITLSPSPDLQVSEVNYFNTKVAGDTISLNYSVLNAGAAAIISDRWQDIIYISNSPTWGTGQTSILQEETFSQALVSGASYNKDILLTLPVGLLAGTYYIYVFTDANDEVFEQDGANDNNILRGTKINISPYPEIDLKVEQAEANQITPQAGSLVRVEYMVANISSNNVVFPYRDAVYLSNDQTFDENSDRLLGVSNRRQSLSVGGSYQNFIDFTLPNGLSGEFFFLLVSDFESQNRDVNRLNNVLPVNVTIEGQGNGGGERPVTIYSPPPPDLIISAFSSPTEGVAGQPLEVIYTISNQGDSTTIPNTWKESVYLASDAQGRFGKIPLGSKGNKRSLAIGESYTDTLELILPISLQGNYFLIVETDAGNKVYEALNEGNNLASSSLSISRPPISDLQINSITTPEMAYTGEEVTVIWGTINRGSNPATGVMQEAVYLSIDTILDIEDIRLGVKTQNLNLAPEADYSDSLTEFVGSLKEGDYYVLVNTDVRNNIFESEEQNNINYSITPISIKVKPLPLETLVTESLFHKREKYFKLDIPPTLHGESITLQLRSEALGAYNEVYIQYGDAATRTEYDIIHTDPFQNNQDVIIPELDSGTYYITLYSNSETTIDQSITLFADILEFEIRDINAKQGGNTGQVTVKIEGAKFEPGISASLQQGGQSITANTIFRRDPTVIFATFDLVGVTLGLYDVVLENTDGETETKINGFEVVEGSAGVTVATGGQSADGTPNICCVFVEGEDNVLLLDIDHPESTRPNRILNMTIEFTNTGNINLPVPNRMLVSMAGAPIAFASAELEKGLTELFLDFDEKDGPPKIFRPGATKKFIIYTKSTAEMRFRLIE